MALPTFELREEPFAVAGGAIEELRRALTVLGPLRDGVRYAAFTDWEVSFRVRPHARPPAPTRTLASESVRVPPLSLAPESMRVPAVSPAPDAALVEVRATLRLPAWRPPRRADPDLVARWERYSAALRRHEMGHVALARAAGEAVLASLAELPPGAPSALVTRAAAGAVARIRAAERAYDVETRHGATQGAALLSAALFPIRPPSSRPAGTEDA